MLIKNMILEGSVAADVAERYKTQEPSLGSRHPCYPALLEGGTDKKSAGRVLPVDAQNFQDTGELTLTVPSNSDLVPLVKVRSNFTVRFTFGKPPQSETGPRRSDRSDHACKNCDSSLVPCHDVTHRYRK